LANRTDTQTIGFLSIVEDADNGCVGGYLVTDLRGNPLRFWSTREKVVVSKLQKLLLGRGLQRYVFCDLLGKSLLEQDDSHVAAVLCDRREMLALRKLMAFPLGAWSGDKFQSHEEYPQDREVLTLIEGELDLVDGPLEIFERIREALKNGADREEIGE